MPWQREHADVAGEIDPDTGDPAYSVVVLTVQRQAGKTAELGPTFLQRCAIGPDRGAWVTAQKRGDARDLWLDVAKRVRRSDLEAGCRFRYGNGSETLALANGSEFRVFAPADDALHGKAIRAVGIDEAWAIAEPTGVALEQAILPTFNTVAGQLWIVSAAGESRSTWFKRWVDAGRAAVDAGRTTGICYLEYGIPDDLDAGDIDAVMSYHPAAGYTLRRQAVIDAAERMTEADFARAYGNRWAITMSRVIAAKVWAESLTDEMIGRDDAIAFGCDVATDRSAASIVACSDAGVIELIDRRPGVQWVKPRLLELNDRHKPVGIAVDSYGPGATVADELARHGLEVLMIPTTRDVATGCADLVDAFTTRRRRHRPSSDLDAAVGAASTRTMGDAWVWARRASAGPIDALTAATLASWAVDRAKVDPPRPRPMVFAG